VNIFKNLKAVQIAPPLSLEWMKPGTLIRYIEHGTRQLLAHRTKYYHALWDKLLQRWFKFFKYIDSNGAPVILPLLYNSSCTIFSKLYGV